MLRHMRGESLEDDTPADEQSYEDRTQAARESLPQVESVDPPIGYVDPETYAERVREAFGDEPDLPDYDEIERWWD